MSDTDPKPSIDQRLDALLASVTAMHQEQRRALLPIDLRIEGLTARHEALTQTVELLALENRQMAIDNRQRDKRLTEIMEGIARLLHVAEIHEHRIT